jgi:predicted membrane protein
MRLPARIHNIPVRIAVLPVDAIVKILLAGQGFRGGKIIERHADVFVPLLFALCLFADKAHCVAIKPFRYKRRVFHFDVWCEK